MNNEEICWSGHLICDDGTNDHIEFELAGDFFCTMPTIDCLCEVVITTGILTDYQDFIDNVEYKTTDTNFSDEIWDNVFTYDQADRL